MTVQARARAPAHASSSTHAGEDLFWRIANPIMAGLIGLILAGSSGAIAGLIAGIALSYVPAIPAALRQVRAVARRLSLWAAPHLGTAWERFAAYLPMSVIRAMAQRRRR